ncbi:MAG: endonuclease [Paucimonas sp.]|nr:endonuclease [Paucimonas sp.]
MPVKITSAGIFSVPGRNRDVPGHCLPPDALAALPRAPGVYIFRDRRRRPLYIGKSVNIRDRIGAHLRNGDEAALLAESVSLDFMETAGEVGALLQESQLIKRWQPRYNSMLLTPGQAWVLASARGELALQVLPAVDAQAQSLRAAGLFPSRSAALQALERLIAQHCLCPGLSGLEKLHPQRGCFARQLGKCRGACAGHEPLAAYRQRRSRALRGLERMAWPFAGPIGVVEERPQLRQVHVINRWCYHGSYEQAPARCSAEGGAFDADVYRIVAPLLQREDVLLLAL